MSNDGFFQIKADQAQLLLHLYRLLPVFFLCLISAAWGQENTHVLLLNSYHNGLDWTDNENAGMRDVLSKNAHPIELHVEYMDTKRLADAAHLVNFREWLETKYSKTHFDAILITDNDAFDFIRTYRNDALFAGVPVVFAGVNFYQNKMLAGLSGFTGVAETFEAGQTIALMRRLHPGMKHVVVIIDGTTTGQAIRKDLEPMLVPFAGKIQFEFWDKYTLAEMRIRLASLHNDTQVLLMPFARDSAGAFISYSNLASMVSTNSSVPVYGTYDFYMGYGIVGGRLTSGVAQGQAAAKILLRIFAGEHPDNIPVITVAPSEFQFDARKLHHFNIAVSELPAGSQVLFQTWYEHYRFRVWSSGLLVTITLLMALGWIRSRMQKHQSDVALKLAEQTKKKLSRAFRLLSQSGPVLIHAKNELQLLTDICQLTVDTGGYLMAWVGFTDDKVSKTVHPVAFFGHDQDYLKETIISWENTASGQSPAGTAIRTKIAFAIQDIHASPQMPLWRDQAIERGYQSCLSLPLIVHDQAIGAMSIYSAETFAFANEEMELLKVLATDFAYGIEALRTKVEHNQALIALKVESEKNLALLHNASDGIHILNSDGNIIETSNSFCAMLGYRREEIIGMNISEWDANFAEDKIPDRIRAQFEQKSRGQFETLHKRKDGTIFQTEVSTLPHELEGQTVLFCSSRDISERKRQDHLIHENELQLLSILNSSPIAVRITTQHARHIEFYNNAYMELINNTHANVADPKTYYVRPAEFENVLSELALGKSVVNRAIEFLIPGRGKVWALASYMPIRYRDEDAVLGWFFDITERKRTEEALLITASVFENTQEAIIITDANYTITEVNAAFTQITGYSREEALGNNPHMLSSDLQGKSFFDEMWQALRDNKLWRGEIWNRRKSGEIYAELLSITAVCDDKGDVLRYVGGFSDISHIKAHEAELSRIAHYDALTGIPNRILLADRMKQAIAQTARERQMLAVCYLDLDGFKQINDTLGHDAGDHVLIEVARRIGNTIRGGDTVARLGGDEFVVLLQGLEQGKEYVATLERMLISIALPISIKGKSISLSASVGVSLYPLDNQDPDMLLRHADHAMYVAKQSGKNRFHIYDPEMDRRARDQHDFLKSIRHGLENKQFELHYQPKVNLRTKELVGAEALIRWRHPERGLLAPVEFLRTIENTELDIELGEWVIMTALAQIDHWRREGLDIEVSINISGYHLESARFTALLKVQLARYSQMPEGRLQIEVLETVALNDIATVKEIIESCRELGVGFALDDFGTGYSSLSYLSGLPVDTLKIDQSFVRDMLTDKGDMAIVQGIILLAQAFGLHIVAEGIETEAQYQALLNMGCESGQGYEIARPMPAGKLPPWYAAFRILPHQSKAS